MDGVVELHRHCVSGSISIFSALSSDILRRYYAQVLEEAGDFGAVLEEVGTGRIVGLTYGTVNPGFQGRFLKHNLLRFIWGIIKGLFTSTIVWRSLWSRVQRKQTLALGGYDSVLEAAGVPRPKGQEALCMFIGVHADHRGGGNARRLLEYYCNKTFESGVSQIRGAVLLSNKASMRFFEKIGWNITKTADNQVSVWTDRPTAKKS